MAYPSRLGLFETSSSLIMHCARSDQSSCLSADVNCLPRSLLAIESDVIFS